MLNMRPLLLINSLHGFNIHAQDGALGRIDDFYFDDQTWKIKHVVVDLGHWLPGRKVLLDPGLLGHADWRSKFIEAKTTKEAIRRSPDSETDLPVASQIEHDNEVYLMQSPVGPEYAWGMHQYVTAPPSTRAGGDNPHLRSTKILKDSSIGSENLRYVGRLADFLVDTQTEEIRFLFMKTVDSRVFLVPSGIVQSIDPANEKISIAYSEDEKAEWQEYDPHHMAVLEIETK